MKEKKTEIQINKKEFYRNLTRLALPIALQSLMLASVAAGDALMLGKVAQDEMTAVSLATQIQFVQNMFLMAITGAGAILGHNYPFYMGFKGGKGIAATAGMVLSFHPYFIVMGVLVFFGIFLTTHYVSLGSLLVYLGLVIEMVVCGQLGVFAGMTQEQLIEMYILAFALAALAYWKHRENIGRLIHGNERKTYLFKKNKPEN